MSLFSEAYMDQVTHTEHADIVVVGGGLMGATIGETLRRSGREVMILDDGREKDGTRPCGGSIKPSPLTGLKREEEYIPLLRLLEDLYGLDEEKFQIRPSGGFVKATIHQVRMYNVLAVPKRKAQVIRLLPSPGVILLEGEDVVQVDAETVIVATGAWVGDLLPHVFPPGSIQAKQGVCFLFNHQTEQAFVKIWAPYKQITVHPFRWSPKREITWASDGTAVLLANWKPSRTEACRRRILAHVPGVPFEVRHGLRPFTKDKHRPCYLQKVQPGIWATTGGGKFGCVAAAWAALRLQEMLR